MTWVRASKTASGVTGSVSRQIMPRPSRHHAFTREEQRAAARDQSGEQGHRAPRQAGDERDQARADAQHQQSAAHAHRAPHRPAVDPPHQRQVERSPSGASGTWRASWTPDSTRSSSRGGRARAHRAGTPADPRPRRRSRPRGPAPQRSSGPCAMLSDQPRRGERVDDRPQPPGQVQCPEHQRDRPGGDADDDHAVRSASYALHQPADHLPHRGGGDDPREDDDLGAGEAFGAGDEGGRRPAGPTPGPATRG